MNYKNKFCVLIIIILIAGLIIFPYAKVEYLTLKHGEEFSDGYKMSNMLDSIAYFKVMFYSEKNAKVYYVQKEHKGADLFIFIKDDNEQWALKSWETIWSERGSADGFYWPYYW